MQTSATDLVGVLTSVERLAVSSLTDDEKVLVLDDMKRCIPPEQFCIHCLKTRAIVLNKIEEAINGFKATQAKSQKPVQSRARKTPTKSTKK